MKRWVTLLVILAVAVCWLCFAFWSVYDYARQTVPPATDPVFCEPIPLGPNEPERPQ